MESLTIIVKMVAMITDACRDAEKLPGALILCGVIQAAAALCLVVSKAPGGLFLQHGMASIYLYYGILIAIVIFGLIEASFGFWVSGDVVGRRAAGKTIMWVSILPLVIVAALGGFVILNVK